MKGDIIQTINHYKGNVEKIGIYAISDKGRLEVQELNLSKGGTLKYKRLRELNRKGEGIYFAPKDDLCNMLFLDDPKHLEELPYGAMVVETSPNKHQLHIPYIGDPQSKTNRTEFQKQLCRIYEADTGATYANHLRRLPSFYNQKYPDKPIIRILYTITNGESLTLEKLMGMVEEAKSKEHFTTLSNERKTRPRPPSIGRMKCWADFVVFKDDGEKDESRTDMRYVLYLLRMGVDEEEIRAKLSQESEEISERKRGRLEYYLGRTIKIAHEYMGL
jgi:hypothetical protein